MDDRVAREWLIPFTFKGKYNQNFVIYPQNRIFIKKNNYNCILENRNRNFVQPAKPNIDSSNGPEWSHNLPHTKQHVNYINR